MILSSILGGVTGLIGSGVSAYFNYKSKKLQIEEKRLEKQFELKKLDKEKELLLAEADAKIQTVTVEANVKRDIEEIDAYKKTIESEEKTRTSLSDLIDRLLSVKSKPLKPFAFTGAVILAITDGIIEIWRKSMRPAITTYQAIITTWLVWKAYLLLEETGKALTPEIASQIFMKASDAVIFLTISTFTWWFGDRQMSRFLQDHLPKRGNKK